MTMQQTITDAAAADRAPAQRLYKAIAAVLDVDPAQLTDGSSPENVASWDSLNHLNIVMALEGEFGIAVSADDALDMGSIAKIRAVLAAHGVEV
jgi:acyl carrier protein